MSLVGSVIPIDSLTPQRRDEMFALMRRYYANMRRARFERDLAEKQWAIEVEVDESGQLAGFSTQMLLDIELPGRRVSGLFSGDTIIDERYRRHNPLAGLWGRLALKLIEQFTACELYWFLISKGYKTYRFLSLFFDEFFPRYDRPTPPQMRDVIAAFGAAKFPGAFDAEKGIVTAKPGACRLHVEAAHVHANRLRDPHVRYFCQRNPNHTLGDELCCIAPLTRNNFTAAAWRVINSVEQFQLNLPMATVARPWTCGESATTLWRE